MTGWFELFLAVLSVVVLIALLAMNRRIDSSLIEVELLGWKIDVYSSVGVAAAFLCAGLLTDTSLARLSPYVDQTIAIVIVMIMLPQPWRMMKDAFHSLTLFVPEGGVTQRIRRLADHKFERYSCEPTFYNTVQTGQKLWVEIYIRNGTNTINVTQLAAIQKQLSSSLQNIYDDVYVEITSDIKEAAD